MVGIKYIIYTDQIFQTTIVNNNIQSSVLRTVYKTHFYCFGRVYEPGENGVGAFGRFDVVP